MSDPTPLSMQAGEPYSVLVTVSDGKLIWAAEDLFEVRSQVRRYASETSTLIADLTDSCTVSYDGDDIVIILSLTGADTRALDGRSGHYDVFISDAGATDARAFRLLYGPLSVTSAVTAAS